MARENLKPAQENLEVVRNEQMEALADSVHRDILNLLQDRGPCTRREIARDLPLGLQETEQYLSGLEAVELLDRVIDEGAEYYLPRARYISVKTEKLQGEEGINMVREFLVERAAEMAGELARLEVEDVGHGSITLHQFRMSSQEMAWVNERLTRTFREIREHLEQSEKDKDAHCRLAFFFYPIRD